MNRNMLCANSTILAALSLMLAGPISCAKNAQPGNDEHEHATPQSGEIPYATSHHDHADGHTRADHAVEPSATARNYADAVKQLQARLASLDTIIKSGQYDDVHKDCVAIGELGGSIGALATAEDSGVPKDKVESLRAAGKELADASRSLHKAAHSDDLATVKAEYAHMGKLIDSLATYVSRP